MKKHLKILALALAFIPNFSQALEYKVLATVNNDAITTSQLRDRVDLIMKSAAMPDTVQNKTSMTREVADILINEALEKQDAAEKNIRITPEETKEILGDMEHRNNLKPGAMKGFLEQKGLSYQSMVDQIEASLLWRKILSTYVRPGLKVTDSDIANAKKKKSDKPVKNKVELAELIIPIEFGHEDQAKELAETIVRTARTGKESFDELASKYSAGKTAAEKGRLGWMPEDGIKEPLGSAIRKTKSGKVSDPVKMESLYVVIKVMDRQPLVPVDKSTPEQQAIMDKMDEGAKKYIKKLRDAAFIEKKYTDEDLYKFVWQ